MKIVIDTEKLQTTPYYAKNCAVTMKDIIKCGPPLPKGHGRLIDADALTLMIMVTDDEILEVVLKEDIDNAPTIIEADKESD